MVRFNGGHGTSVSFLALSVVLYHMSYPTHAIAGLVAQYALSTLVWFPSCPRYVLWMDRTIAVTNVVVLGAAHVRQGIPIGTVLLPLLAIALWCWYNDLTHPRYGTVTRWYVAWHATLFVFNATIALYVA